MSGLRPVDVVFDSRASSNNDLNAPEFRMLPSMENVVGVTLLWSNIPYTWYVIDSTNNDFQMKVGSKGSGAWSEVTYSFTITPGTYSPDTLILEIRRIIGVYVTANQSPDTGLAAPVSGGTTVGAKFNMYLDSPSSKFVMYFEDAANVNLVQFDVKFNSALAELLGFVGDTWIQSSARRVAGTPDTVTGGVDIWRNAVLVQANAAAVSATKCTRLIGPTTIRLLTNIAGMTGSGSTARGPVDDQLMLAKIPVTGNFTSFMFYQHTPEMIPIPDRTQINYVQLSLKHEGRETYIDHSATGTPTVGYLPLNGEGFQVCIRFYTDDGAMSQ